MASDKNRALAKLVAQQQTARLLEERGREANEVGQAALQGLCDAFAQQGITAIVAGVKGRLPGLELQTEEETGTLAGASRSRRSNRTDRAGDWSFWPPQTITLIAAGTGIRADLNPLGRPGARATKTAAVELGFFIPSGDEGVSRTYCCPATTPAIPFTLTVSGPRGNGTSGVVNSAHLAWHGKEDNDRIAQAIERGFLKRSIRSDFHPSDFAEPTYRSRLLTQLAPDLSEKTVEHAFAWGGALVGGVLGTAMGGGAGGALLGAVAGLFLGFVLGALLLTW